MEKAFLIMDPLQEKATSTELYPMIAKEILTPGPQNTSRIFQLNPQLMKYESFQKIEM